MDHLTEDQKEEKNIFSDSKEFYDSLDQIDKELEEINKKVAEINVDESIAKANELLGRMKEETNILNSKSNFLELMGIFPIIINSRNSDILNKKFKTKLLEFSPESSDLNNEEWSEKHVFKIDDMLSKENFDTIYSSFQKLFEDSEEVVCFEDVKNAEYKAHLLHYMIYVDNWKKNPVLEQHLKEIFDKYHFEKTVNSGGIIWQYFYDLYPKITKDNYEDILTTLYGDTSWKNIKVPKKNKLQKLWYKFKNWIKRLLGRV